MRIRGRKRPGRGGFTLVELMVVLVIIGILVAVAVPLYVGAENNAQNKVCQANLRIVDGAINVAAMSSNPAVTTLFTGRVFTGTVADLTAQGFIKGGEPLCPQNNQPYTIVNGAAYCPLHHY